MSSPELGFVIRLYVQCSNNLNQVCTVSEKVPLYMTLIWLEYLFYSQPLYKDINLRRE